MRYATTMAATMFGALLVASPFAAQAQQSTTDKMMDKGKSTTEEAKTAVNDSWITSKTKIALFSDERVKGTQVSVDTKDGVVTLNGIQGPNDGWLILTLVVPALLWLRMSERGSWISVIRLLGASHVLDGNRGLAR